jgi:GMP synthase-like glutamine amidotransferase
MKTLIVNNHTMHLSELIQLFPNATLIEMESLKKVVNIEFFDCVVISGGSAVPTVLHHPELYQEEIAFIQNCSIPLLGICLGCELIVHAFGGALKELPEKYSGAVEITTTDNTLSEFFSSKSISTLEAHRIGIEKLPPTFMSVPVQHMG